MKTNTYPQIHQLVPNLAEFDAIGNYSLKIRQILRRAGYQSDIYVLEAALKLRRHCKHLRKHRKVSSPDNVLIFHHSIGSPLTGYFKERADRKVLIYHNITPPRFFAGINREIYYLAASGRKELRSLAGLVELSISDSDYNRRELEAIGYRYNVTLPIMINSDWLDIAPSEQVMHQFDDDKINIVFVGRISPNKKQEDLIRAFFYYKNYFNSSSRLVLVGSPQQVPEYFRLLQALVCRLGLKDVLFMGAIDQAELNAVYRRAHLFFSASEHEGFCIPLLEAMYFGVPVLAFEAAAVSETMAGAGMLYQKKHPLKTAALIDRIITDHNLRQKIVESETRRLNDFDTERIERKFLDIIAALGRETEKK